MGKYIGLFFCVLVILCSCNDNTPKGVLDKERMIGLLIDMHITNSSMLVYSAVPDTLYKYGTGRYLNVFKKNNTDSAQFNKSLKYYASQPDVLMEIYDDVLKKLQAKSDSLNKVFQKEVSVKGKKNVNKQVVGSRRTDSVSRSKSGIRYKGKLGKADTIKSKE